MDAIGLPRVELPEQSGLVWVTHPDGRQGTLWVSLADGSPLTTQEIDGAVLAAGERLWKWESRPREVAVHASSDGEPAGFATVFEGALRDLVAGEEVVLFPAPEPGVVRDVTHEIRLEGSVGPYLFFVSALSLDAFGAHGQRELTQQILDVHTMRSADGVDEGAEAFVATARAAEQRFGGTATRVALHPHWTAEGLWVGARHTHDVCYACSDGVWSDYTESVELRIDPTPPPFAESAALPAWAREAAATLPDAVIGGFSVVEESGPAHALEALRR